MISEYTERQLKQKLTVLLAVKKIFFGFNFLIWVNTFLKHVGFIDPVSQNLKPSYGTVCFLYQALSLKYQKFRSTHIVHVDIYRGSDSIRIF